MAINGMNPDSRSEFINSLNQYELIYVWQHLDAHENHQPKDVDDLRSIVTILVSQLNIDINLIKMNISSHVIKEEHLVFFDEKNKRQILYFNKWIKRNFPYTFKHVPEIFKNDVYIECITNFNQISINGNSSSIIEKIQQLNFFKVEWNTIFLDKKASSWLDKNNQEQVQWAYEYLKMKGKIAFDCLVDPTDLYTFVISGIDSLWMVNPAEKLLFIDKMRRAWSQKKFRDDGKTKKPYHLPLTKEAHKQLEFLAQVLNKSTAQILESMIRDKYQEYSDQKTGKNLY
ncbi:hypothetical protein [Acinetobacter sp. ANC 5502]